MNSTTPHLRSGPSYAGRRVGLLGGSFNPAHQGHRAVSLFALKRLGLHEIWWLVSPQNPLKSSKNMASFSTRLAASKAMANHPKIVVLDLENETHTLYTVELLRALKKRYGRTHFVWLMGADNLKQIPKWRNWAAIFNLAPVAVFRRPSYVAGCRQGKAAQRLSRSWRAVGTEGRGLALKPAPIWTVLDNPLNKLSATKIRERLRREKS